MRLGIEGTLTMLSRGALAIREKALGPERPTASSTLNNPGVLFREQRRYTEAEPLARRALANREARLGPNHPDVAKTLDNLAKACDQTGRTAEAQELSARAQRTRAQAQAAPEPANPQ